MTGKQLLVLQDSPLNIPVDRGSIVTVTYHHIDGRIQFKETGDTVWRCSDSNFDPNFKLLPDKSDNFDNLYLKLCGGE